MTLDARLIAAKTHVEAMKTRVRELQAALSEAKQLAEGQWPRQPATWRAYQSKKKEWQAALNDLSDAKLELVRLSGTSGGDPRWILIREAWHVLNELDERGVVLGERGEALMDEIEFHVPHSKLHADGGADGR